MRAEYGVGSRTGGSAALCARFSGTVVGSFVWGTLADVYGRRATIVLSSVMFIGTSICGAMPSFWWNVGMCFMMGAAAGGMLPVAYALLAEVMPTRHRGWSTVLVGGIGAIGGFFAASSLSALLQPVFGWRVMWFLNLPTGLILVLLSPYLPESARFLQHIGRGDIAARLTVARFGSGADRLLRPSAPGWTVSAPVPPVSRGFLGIHLAALTLSGLAWGHGQFRAVAVAARQRADRGRSQRGRIERPRLRGSTLLAATGRSWCARGCSAPGATQVVAHHHDRPRWSRACSDLSLQQASAAGLSHPLLPLALVITGSCGLISMLLPYAAEHYPLRIRGRATGWVACYAASSGGLHRADTERHRGSAVSSR